MINLFIKISLFYKLISLCVIYLSLGTRTLVYQFVLRLLAYYYIYIYIYIYI